MKALLFLRRHAAVVWLLTAVLVAVGVKSAFDLPSGIYPEVEFPRIVVVARTGGAPPDVFLTRVTRPLEEVLTSVLGVQRVRSRTIRGATEISLLFSPSADMWRALQLTESRVAEVRSTLPPDAEVIVERVTTGSFPVVSFNVAGPVDPRELRELAQFVVRPALANVPGVGRIEVLGGDVREIEVILRPEVAAAQGLTPTKIADRLRTSLGLFAVGRVDQSRQLVTVLADALPRSIDEIESIPIAVAPDGTPVPLGAVAEVAEAHADRLVRVGGPRGETVGISVARLPGASTPAVVDEALAAIERLRPTLPAGVSIEPVYDQADLVRESMVSVRDAILIGVALCALVIGLFLRDLRAGLTAAITVPLTLAITFAAMRVAGQTLNLMSLGGMAVAIGLVVDDAIVTVEAIAHRRDAGDSASDAAIRGPAELAAAIIGTTATTVVVLVPMAFLEGIVGDFFRALAFTLGVAVVISLALSLGVIPLAAGFGISSRRTPRPDRMAAAYRRFAERLLSRKTAALIAFLLLLVLGAVLAPRLERGFLPTMDEGAFVLDYFLPAGTSLATTEESARALERELSATPEVRSFTRRTGAELGPAAATQLNRGDIMVRLVPASRRRRSAEEVIADVRGRIESRYPEVRVEFVQVLQDVLNDLSGSPRPVEIKLFGPDYEKLFAAGQELASKMNAVPGLVDIYDGREREAPELRFVVQRDEVARLGMTADDVSRELETSLLGVRVGDIRRFDRLVGIRVRYPDSVRFDRERVLDLPFVIHDKPVGFSAVTKALATTSPSQLLHEALEPLVAVTADHEGRDLGSIAADIDRLVAGLNLPPGYRALIGGQIAAQRESLRELALAGGFAVLLVLTVLAAQFRRLRLAVIVLSSIPTAMVGAIAGLTVTRTPLNASSLMGCVLLVGLVVKNGVLLLEEAERELDRGKGANQAVLDAADRRLRPVVMTTVATLAGLLPLAFGIGSGAEIQRPLAVAVIGGLLTSAVATLGLLPPFAAFLLRNERAPREPRHQNQK